MFSSLYRVNEVLNRNSELFYYSSFRNSKGETNENFAMLKHFAPGAVVSNVSPPYWTSLSRFDRSITVRRTRFIEWTAARWPNIRNAHGTLQSSCFQSPNFAKVSRLNKRKEMRKAQRIATRSKPSSSTRGHRIINIIYKTSSKVCCQAKQKDRIVCRTGPIYRASSKIQIRYFENRTKVAKFQNEKKNKKIKKMKHGERNAKQIQAVRLYRVDVRYYSRKFIALASWDKRYSRGNLSNPRILTVSLL